MEPSERAQQLGSSSRLAFALGLTLVLLVLATAAWRSVNESSGWEPGPDSSMFISMGWHVENGRALYREVWDHKPPVIFALNAAADAIGKDGINSVRTMERIFLVVGVVAFVTIVLLSFGNLGLAGLMGVLYLMHAYAMPVVEIGNVTEEYGAVFVLVGIAAGLATLRVSSRWAGWSRGLAGFAFALALLTKEPFVLVIPAWSIWIMWPTGGSFRTAGRKAAEFLAGAAVPFVCFLVYLFATSAWADWVDTVAFNLANKAGAMSYLPDQPWVFRIWLMAKTKVQPLTVELVLAVLGLVALFRRDWVRRHHGVPLVMAVTALSALIATSIGGGFSGHYYLFFLGPFLLLCASGLAMAREVVARRPRWVPLGLAALISLFILNAAELKAFATSLRAPAQRWAGHPMSEIVRQYTKEGDLVWAPWEPLLYVESRRLSPTRWFFIFDHLFIDTPASTASQKLAMLRDDLEQRPPRAIVLNAPAGSLRTRQNADAFLAKSGLASWIAANYRTAWGSTETEFELLLWNGPDPAASK